MDNIKRLAKKLLQHKGDMPLATLDATLELQDSLEEVKKAIQNIPETVMPEHPTEMEVTMKGISVVTLKGEKGDSPTEEELVSLIKPLIPEPIPGKKGDKGDTMIVEKIIERIETIVEQPIITNEIKEVAVTDTAEVIVSKVNELPTNDDTLKIDASHIKNLPEFKNGNYYGGSGIKEIVAGSGVTVDNTNPGYPVVAVSSSGSGITRSINSISSPTTAGATASTDYVYLVSGTTTITLPTAVGNTNQYTIKCVSGTTTIATTSAQTIDGSASAVLSVANTSLTLVSDNSNWNII